MQEFGKTPREWGELDPHERRFLERAYIDRLEREKEQHEKMERKARRHR